MIKLFDFEKMHKIKKKKTFRMYQYFKKYIYTKW